MSPEQSFQHWVANGVVEEVEEDFSVPPEEREHPLTVSLLLNDENLDVDREELAWLAWLACYEYYGKPDAPTRER